MNVLGESFIDIIAGEIGEVGGNIDDHVLDGTIHFERETILHANLAGVGTLTHDQLEVEIGNNTTAIGTNAGLIATSLSQIADLQTESTGSVTIHSDVTSAGSGEIITAVERNAIATNTSNNTGSVTVHSDVTSAGSGQIITAVERNAIATNTSSNTGSVTIHSDVTSAGSGSIITAVERNAIATNTSSNTGSVTIHSDVTDAGSGAIITAVERNDISLNTAHRSEIDIHLPRDDINPVSLNTLWSSQKINQEIQNVVAGTSGVTSVAGKTGAVLLNTSDVSEDPINLYFTNDRVANAPSVTANTAHRSPANDNIHRVHDDNQTTLTTLWSSQKIRDEIDVVAGTSGVTSVNTLTGAVTLTTDEISEGTGFNRYYTETRVLNNAGVVANTNHRIGAVNTHSQIDAHIGTSNIHAVLDNNSTSLTTLWSSQKIQDELTNISTGVGNLTTTDIPEGTNLYFTAQRVNDEIADVIVTDTLKVKTITRDLGIDNPTVPVTELGNDGYLATVSNFWSTPGKEHFPFRAFDEVDTTAWQSNDPTIAGTYNSNYQGAVTTVANTGSYAGEWIQIQLPSAISVGSYTIKFPTNAPDFDNAPEDFRLFIGSSPTGPWTQIHDVSGEDWQGETVYELKYDTDDTVTSGSYIRLAVKRVIKITNGGSAKIAELKFNTQQVDPSVSFLRKINTTDILSTGTITAPSVVTTNDLTTELIKSPFAFGGTVDVIAGGGTINLNTTSGTINLNATNVNLNAANVISTGLIASKNNLEVFNPNDNAFTSLITYTGTTNKDLDLQMIESVTGSIGGEISLPPPMSAPTLVDGTGTWVSSYSEPPTSVSNHFAWKAFSGSNLNFFNSGVGYNFESGAYTGSRTTVANTGSHLGEFIQIEFPNPFTITKYAIGGRGDSSGLGWTNFGQYCSPKALKVFSSNDGSTWVEVDTQTDAAIPDPSVTVKKEFILPGGPAEGRYFRLVALSIVGTGNGSGLVDRNFLNIGTLEYIVVNDGDCPVGGCLRATTKMDIQGDLNVSVNTQIDGTLSVGIPAVLQDTNPAAYKVVIGNTGIDVAMFPGSGLPNGTFAIGVGIGTDISPVFQNAIINKNMGATLSSCVTIPGIYKIELSLTYTVNAKSLSKIEVYKNSPFTPPGRRAGSLMADEAKDEYANRSLTCVIGCQAGEGFTITVEGYVSPSTMIVFGAILNIMRISDNS